MQTKLQSPDYGAATWIRGFEGCISILARHDDLIRIQDSVHARLQKRIRLAHLHRVRVDAEAVIFEHLNNFLLALATREYDANICLPAKSNRRRDRAWRVP
jgi:hypothetical protein